VRLVYYLKRKEGICFTRINFVKWHHLERPRERVFLLPLT